MDIPVGLCVLSARRFFKTVFIISVSLTDFSVEYCSLMQMHQEVKHKCTVATVHGLQCVVIRSCLGVWRIGVKRIAFALYYLGIDYGIIDRVYHKLKVHHAVAAIDCLELLSVKTCRAFRKTELVVGFSLTDFRRNGIVINRVDCKIQYNQTVCTINSLMILLIRSGLGNIETIFVIRLPLTNINIKLRKCVKMYKQIKHYHTVATR